MGLSNGERHRIGAWSRWLLPLGLSLALIGCAGDHSLEDGRASSQSASRGDDKATDGDADDADVDDGFGNSDAAGDAAAPFLVDAGLGSGGDEGDDDGPENAVPPTPARAEHCDVIGCPEGLQCADSGVCITPPPPCLAAADCADGQRCGLTGECLDPGRCKVDQDCGEAESCRAQQCVIGTDCGQEALTIEPIPPNVLILLDQSGSMGDDVNGTDCGAGCSACTCKMQHAASAIDQVTTSYRDRIYWGLASFPSDGNCGPPTNVIVPAPGQEDLVATTAGAIVAAGSTPIQASMEHIRDSNYLSDPSRRNYLLFISDGEERCDGSQQLTVDAITTMRNAGIGTIVVGFGSGAGGFLNPFAVAGGQPNPDPNLDYYQADTAAELETALGNILDALIGCDFALAAAPDDPAEVYAFMDNVLVPRDDPDGWSLDTTDNTVTFAGQACDQLRSGVVNISLVFGCPEPVLE